MIPSSVLRALLVLGLTIGCNQEPTGEAPAAVPATSGPADKRSKVDGKPLESQQSAAVDLPAPADVAAAPADAVKTASGLAYRSLQDGQGTVHPKPEATVEVHYTGWTTDGKMFDSSAKRNKTAKFPLKAVIAGWTEGLQTMTIGQKTRFWIPEALAYQGKPGKPAGMLVFDVELVNFTNPPEAPADVAAPPKDAKKTASGLAYRVLQPGKGTVHPAPTNRVRVHYSGWTTDGQMFDSSVTRGQPLVFALNRVIPGWTEGVQLMVEGESTRFWVPQELAYKGQAGAPAGMLVFDVELIEIVGESSTGAPKGGAPH
jgi:peptidylprolyl isomerase